MLDLTESEKIRERKRFLQEWKAENISYQIERLKHDLSAAYLRKNISKLLFKTCIEMLDFYREEYAFWSSVQLSPEAIICTIRRRQMKGLYPITMHNMKIHIASIREMIRTQKSWGNREQYLDYLVDVLETILDLIKDNIADVEFIRRVVNNLKSIPSYFEKYRYLNNVLGDIRLNEHSSPQSYFNVIITDSDGDSLRKFMAREKYPYGRVQNTFDLLCAYRYYRVGRGLSRIFIRQCLQLIPFSKRNNPKIIKYLISELITRFNDYLAFASSPRFHFRLGEKYISNVVLQMSFRPGMKFLEIFGNIPIISLVAVFLGAEATVIDYHFELTKGSISNHISQVSTAMQEGNLELAEKIMREFEQKEKISYTLEPDISSSEIKIPGILESCKFLIPSIKENLHLRKYDMNDFDAVIQELPPNTFDAVFIDPPFNIKTDYMGQDMKQLTLNALKLAKHCRSSQAKVVISLPPVKQREGDKTSKRKELLEILKNMGAEFKKPSKNSRVLILGSI